MERNDLSTPHVNERFEDNMFMLVFGFLFFIVLLIGLGVVIGVLGAIVSGGSDGDMQVQGADDIRTI